MIGLPITINWKKDSYNFMFIIIHQLIKMVYHKLVKITMNA